MDVFSLFDPDVVLVLVVICFILSLLLRRRVSSLGPLPPGPVPLPVIGNALQLPTKDPQLKYRQWYERYGDIVHLTAAGQHIVILNSAQAAFDLLEKRGKAYSGRPASVMVKMVRLDETWSLLPYGDTLRHFRRLGHYAMSIQAIKKYELVQEEEARCFTRAILSSSECLVHHINRVSSVIMLRLLYGYSPSLELDKINTAAQKLVVESQALISNKSRILDVFPVLRHIPPWFPLISFQRKAEELGRIRDYVFDIPFNMVKRGLETVCAFYLEVQRSNVLFYRMNKGFTRQGAPFAQLFLTKTASSLHAFFMIMATHQDIQAKARAEILSVVGDHRLPNLSDRKSFVYLTAVQNELLRFHSAAPLGLPHLLEEDDTYDGYWIPKGSVVIANIWEMMHDENVYPDPFSFRPERFLGSHEKSRSGFPYFPSAYVFGFGRRSCPGMHFAEASLLIIMATVLATCEITPCRSEDGIEIPIENKFTPTLVLHPVPFQCAIKPYSRDAASLLRHATAEIRGSGH
ncbi:cytochrome P450 [Hysterangium stoloniferum]|nr:cytochrome P450 [Hysterangium stoloniferum]